MEKLKGELPEGEATTVKVVSPNKGKVISPDKGEEVTFSFKTTMPSVAEEYFKEYLVEMVPHKYIDQLDSSLGSLYVFYIEAKTSWWLYADKQLSAYKINIPGGIFL